MVAGKRDETQMIWRDYVELCREYVLTAEERHLWRSKYDAIRVDAIALYSVHVHQMDALYLCTTQGCTKTSLKHWQDS